MRGHLRCLASSSGRRSPLCFLFIGHQAINKPMAASVTSIAPPDENRDTLCNTPAASGISNFVILSTSKKQATLGSKLATEGHEGSNAFRSPCSDASASAP